MSNQAVKQKRILVVIRHGNRGDPRLKEALDLAMVTAAFGQAITLLFVEDGIYHWSASQQSEKIKMKPYHKILAALELYEIDQCYLCEQSVLARRSISALENEPTCLDRQAIIDLMEGSDVIIDY